MDFSKVILAIFITVISILMIGFQVISEAKEDKIKIMQDYYAEYRTQV